MATVPYFTELDFNNLNDWHEVTIPFDKHSITIDLNFHKKSVDPPTIDKIAHFLANLSNYHTFNVWMIRKEYTDGVIVSEFLEFHLEELFQEDLDKMIDPSNTTVSKEEQLLASLRLVRVGLYPENETEDSFGIFDYSLGPEISDQLLVINLRADGSFRHMTTES